MASMRFPLPVGETSAVADLSPEARTYLRDGFAAALKLDAATLELAAERALQALSGAEEVDGASAARELGVSENEAPLVVAAVGSVAVALAADASPEDAAENFVKGGVLQEQDRRWVVETCASAIRKKVPQFKAVFARNRLATRILPSFANLATSIDLRLAFGSERVAVPVAIAILRTDVTDQYLRFQLTRADALKMIERLQTAAARLKEAEGLAETWTKGK